MPVINKAQVSLALEEYASRQKPSLRVITTKYGIARSTLTDRLCDSELYAKSVMDRLLMCERHNTPCQDTSVSLSRRSIRAEGAVKTLHFSDLSLLYEGVTIATFAIHAYTYYIYFAYLLYIIRRSLLPIYLNLFLIFKSLYL